MKADALPLSGDVSVSLCVNHSVTCRIFLFYPKIRIFVVATAPHVFICRTFEFHDVAHLSLWRGAKMGI